MANNHNNTFLLVTQNPNVLVGSEKLPGFLVFFLSFLLGGGGSHTYSPEGLCMKTTSKGLWGERVGHGLQEPRFW